MKKKIVSVLLMVFFLCGCGKADQANLFEESQEESVIESVIENVDTEETGLEESSLQESSLQESIPEVDSAELELTEIETTETEEAKEGNENTDTLVSDVTDKATISREEWIEQALQEEQSRRVMPELQGAEDIITYIGKTGGKAYKGTYNGEIYYLYLSAECNWDGRFIPCVTVVKEKDTSKNPEEFGGRENFYGIVRDETECFLDIDTRYKYGYIGSGLDRVIGDFIECDGFDWKGESLHFNSGTDIVYTFREYNPSDETHVKKDIQFYLMEPDEAKYWYSQNAMRGDWNDFMYYDGYYGDYYVRVEFTDGRNMMDGNSHYYMTLLSSVEDLDTFNEKKYQIMTRRYSYSEYSRLEDDEFMLEFISDRQAVLTNKHTGTSALVKYNKGYLSENKAMNDSEFYFYDTRIVERHDYTFEGKAYMASDGTIISFTAGSSWVDHEDITDVGERTVDIFYQGGRSVLTTPVHIVDGKTIRIIDESSNTDLLFIWSDDNHFEVKGTGAYLPDIDGMIFSYEENQLYGY